MYIYICIKLLLHRTAWHLIIPDTISFFSFQSVHYVDFVAATRGECNFNVFIFYKEHHLGSRDSGTRIDYLRGRIV